MKEKEKEKERDIEGLLKYTGAGSIDDVSALHSFTESTDRLGSRLGTGTGTQPRRSSTAGATSTSTSASSSHTLTLKDAGVGVASISSMREGECGEDVLMEKHRDLERRREKEKEKQDEKEKQKEQDAEGQGAGSGKRAVVPTRLTVKRASSRAQQDAKRRADMAIRSKR